MRDRPPGSAHAPSVSLHQLRLFITLARYRSFTRVGDEFGITQSAVSRSIRELEDEIALRLFDRTTRHVTLTDTGRKLLSRIAPLVEELEATLRPRASESGEPGVVNLACSCGLTASVLPPLFASCRERLPDITVVLMDRPQNAVLQLVRSGEAELGVVIAPDNLDDLASEPLFADGFAAVVHGSHRLAGAGRVDWQQLRGTPLLLLDDDTGSLAAIEAALARYAVTGAVRQRLAQSAAVARMAEAGLGVGVLPMHARNACESDRVRFIPLAPDESRTIMLVRRRGRALHASAASVWWHFIASSTHTLIASQAIEA
ncbi:MULTISPECIES: LysR family transcriptional regulator [unclassified Caballeronia]|uniref:LysR family transcriptional regulator n=1 Tax=unclassified Caballeronia TaxID=2646786 RepID=UPI0028542A4F|nr:MULTISPECIES: LysR family transcriptional regulator [unclassified Caballeronia]MDR5739886.1 LysR family transcriptional regulator [Caballeronia sp. LZ016]MDR5808351.1 LysR family transcriptional regulator [Caballeronia sp. LZ019]